MPLATNTRSTRGIYSMLDSNNVKISYLVLLQYRGTLVSFFPPNSCSA